MESCPLLQWHEGQHAVTHILPVPSIMVGVVLPVGDLNGTGSWTPADDVPWAIRNG